MPARQSLVSLEPALSWLVTHGMPSESDDSRLFRALLFTFTPLLLGSGFAARAWALPPADPLPGAVRYAEVPHDRVMLPPPQPIPTFVLVPREAPMARTDAGSARNRPAPEPRTGRESVEVIGTIADGLDLDFPVVDDALDRALGDVRDDRASLARDFPAAPEHAPVGDIAIGIAESGPERIGSIATRGTDVRRPPGVVREPDPPSGEGIPRFAETMRQQRGRIESCAQTALKRDPGLSGRIELGWDVVNGKTTAIHVVGDRVGDAEFSRCVQAAVRSLRFADESYGSVDGYTWLVSGR